MCIMAWTVLIESHAQWQVLRRDGRRCVVSGQRDNWFKEDTLADALPGFVDAVRIFEHPLVVYKEIYDTDEVCAVDTGRFRRALATALVSDSINTGKTRVN